MSQYTEERNKSRLSKVHVLVIDDDVVMASLVKELLKKLGFAIITVVHSAVEGIRYLRIHQVDLIITDWEMDDLSGIDLTRIVRDMEYPQSMIPIIMLTGHGEKKDIEVARDNGVTEYLIKPFTAKNLCNRIMTVIDKPRSFILCRNYKGPSRRRRMQDPLESTERRKRKDKKL